MGAHKCAETVLVPWHQCHLSGRHGLRLTLLIDRFAQHLTPQDPGDITHGSANFVVSVPTQLLSSISSFDQTASKDPGSFLTLSAPILHLNIDTDMVCCELFYGCGVSTLRQRRTHNLGQLTNSDAVIANVSWAGLNACLPDSPNDCRSATNHRILRTYTYCTSPEHRRAI